MYKLQDKQIGLTDFGQPLGMTLNPKNRWVQKASLIPWDEIEVKYAALFESKTGNVAKPLRLALGALLIQIEFDYSDEEVVNQIQENPYLQYFVGLPNYKDERPFDSSLMVHFRKRLTLDVLKEVNEIIIKSQTSKKKNSDDHDRPSGPNQGTMIVDATCAPSDVKFPQDTELLNEAREKLEGMIVCLHQQIVGNKPRTYCRRARKDYLNIARSKKRSAKKIRKAIRKQLGYVKRDMRYVEEMLQAGGVLTAKQVKILEIIKKLYEQQKYMYDHRTHSVPQRIISISQPYLRPIVRGKSKSPVEFGAKLDISVVDGYTRLEKVSFEAYNEGECLIEMIERYSERTGKYPERVLADKIYRNRSNLTYCKEKGIRLLGPALGRPKKDAIVNKKEEYKDNCERVEVERRFSLAKRKFGLGFIRTRLAITNHAVIGLSILAMNLSKILGLIFKIINLVVQKLKITALIKIRAVIQ